MSPDEQMQFLRRKGEEIQDALGLDGLVIIGTGRAEDGDTVQMSQVFGNRDAAEGAADRWVRDARSYAHGYKADQGRYDSTVIRQRNQERRRRDEDS